MGSEMCIRDRSQVSSLQGAVDWYWSRAAKGGTAVPDAIRYHAAAIYTEMEAKETAIDAMTTLDEIIAYQNHPMVETRKVQHTSEEGVVTYGPQTEVSNMEVNKVKHGWSSLIPAHPSFVSLVDA